MSEMDRGVVRDRAGWHAVLGGRDLGVFQTPEKAWQHLMDEMDDPPGGWGPFRYGDAWRAVYFGRDLGVCATEEEVFRRMENASNNLDREYRLRLREKVKRLNAFPRYKPVRVDGSAKRGGSES
jgi:hypothetical protein